VSGDFFNEAVRCSRLCDPEAKCAAVTLFAAAARSGVLLPDFNPTCFTDSQPGRPTRPVLVNPASVPRRRLGTPAGRAALVHAIAHIEFNAVNLALDAVCRFREMPHSYYLDWVSVAADEAQHFRMLEGRLAAMGLEYGDLPAHGGLWEMADGTADSCLARMALVPRVLEARGLDVTPAIIERLRQTGDTGTVAVLEVILREEVEHVAIGTRWFNFCCEREGKDPLLSFLELLRTRYSGTIRGPFNYEARLAAGFSPVEMEALAVAFDD